MQKTTEDRGMFSATFPVLWRIFLNAIMDSSTEGDMSRIELFYEI